MTPSNRWVALVFLLASPLFAQKQSPPPPPGETPPHDITMVDSAPLGGSISVPLPPQSRRRARYEVPELAGSRQALGSQLIDGALPRPIVDYIAQDATVQQRLSIFDGGLVVINIRGSGGPIRKRLIIPDDALKTYLKIVSPTALATIHPMALPQPRDDRRAALRVYSSRKEYVERVFDPTTTLTKSMNDQIVPLRDLLRAITEDRTVTNTVAGYIPKPGDELVSDDRKVYRVMRVLDQQIVELRCTSQATTIYVAIKDLYNYFIGTTGASKQ